MRRALLDEGCECTYIAVLLGKLCLGYSQLLLLLLVRDRETFIVFRVDVWCVVAHDGLDVLVFCFLLQVLHLQFSQKCLQYIK